MSLIFAQLTDVHKSSPVVIILGQMRNDRFINFAELFLCLSNTPRKVVGDVKVAFRAF